MERRLLIVRSVSFQQLDLLLPPLRGAFPEHRFELLTHAHGLAIARTYPEFQVVHSYPHAGSFRFGMPVPDLGSTEFDVVLVPVASMGGGGYFNVLLFAFGLAARQRLICLPDGSIRPLTAGGVLARAARHLGLALVAGLAAVPLGLAAMLALPLILGGLKRSRGGEEQK